MSYLFIDFDETKKVFVSHDRVEKNITFNKDLGLNYYLHKSRRFVVSLVKGWVSAGETLGKIIDLNGSCLSEIPHPGSMYGEFEIGGISSGDESSFKLIITPNSNERQYFLTYHISSEKFEEVRGLMK